MTYIIAITVFSLFSPLQPGQCRELTGLFLAIEAVESGGNPSLIGADGERGLYQIRPIFVDDINRILGESRFSYEDRLSKSRSEKMMLIYWQHYATERRLGRSSTFSDLARIFNGGPDGHKKKATKKYWLKVKKEMEILK